MGKCLGLTVMREEVETPIYLSQSKTTLEKLTFYPGSSLGLTSPENRFLLSIFSFPIPLPSSAYRLLPGAFPQHSTRTKSLPVALLSWVCPKTAAMPLHLPLINPTPHNGGTQVLIPLNLQSKLITAGPWLRNNVKKNVSLGQ